MNLWQFMNGRFDNLICEPEYVADFKSMPINTPCGSECVTVVMAAEQMEHQIRRAFGDGAVALLHNNRMAMFRVCSCFITG